MTNTAREVSYATESSRAPPIAEVALRKATGRAIAELKHRSYGKTLMRQCRSVGVPLRGTVRADGASIGKSNASYGRQSVDSATQKWEEVLSNSSNFILILGLGL